MMKIYYFSGTNHSKKVAEYVGGRLGIKTVSIEELVKQRKEQCHTAVVVFPVYCERVPKLVQRFLKRLEANGVALIATYGNVCPGNALCYAQKRIKGQIIAGAYVATGHTYLNEEAVFDAGELDVICEKIRAHRPCILPKQKGHFWAHLFPRWRSQLGVSITRNAKCNHCGICERQCPMQAIHKERIGIKCIRCLRCVNNCPQGALEFTLHPILKAYLQKERKGL